MSEKLKTEICGTGSQEIQKIDHRTLHPIVKSLLRYLRHIPTSVFTINQISSMFHTIPKDVFSADLEHLDCAVCHHDADQHELRGLNRGETKCLIDDCPCENFNGIWFRPNGDRMRGDELIVRGKVEEGKESELMNKVRTKLANSTIFKLDGRP